jgi:hypothetical protein
MREDAWLGALRGVARPSDRLDAISVWIEADATTVRGVRSDAPATGPVLHVTTRGPRPPVPPPLPPSGGTPFVAGVSMLVCAAGFLAYDAFAAALVWWHLPLIAGLLSGSAETTGLRRAGLAARRSAVARRQARGGLLTGQAWRLTGDFERDVLLTALMPVRRVDAALAGLAQIRAPGQPPMVDIPGLRVATARALADLSGHLTRHQALTARLDETQTAARLPAAADPHLRRELARVEVELRAKATAARARIREATADLDRLAAVAERVLHRWHQAGAARHGEAEVQRILRASWAAVDADTGGLAIGAGRPRRPDRRPGPGPPTHHHRRPLTQIATDGAAEPPLRLGRDARRPDTELVRLAPEIKGQTHQISNIGPSPSPPALRTRATSQAGLARCAGDRASR